MDVEEHRQDERDAFKGEKGVISTLYHHHERFCVTYHAACMYAIITSIAPRTSKQGFSPLLC